jgi:hypothetical protein
MLGPRGLRKRLPAVAISALALEGELSGAATRTPVCIENLIVLIA